MGFLYFSSLMSINGAYRNHFDSEPLSDCWSARSLRRNIPPYPNSLGTLGANYHIHSLHNIG